jgi:hypothetical protein
MEGFVYKGPLNSLSFICTSILPACVYVHQMLHWDPRRGIRRARKKFSEQELHSCELTWILGTSPNPLEEQQVLKTTATSLQPLENVLSTKMK